MHRLHECKDILGQVIYHEKKPPVRRRKFYFADVVDVLTPGELQNECRALIDNTAWISGFVNYSKHHSVVDLFRQFAFVSPVQPVSYVEVSVFIHDGVTYSSKAAFGYAVTAADLVEASVNSIIAHLV